MDINDYVFSSGAVTPEQQRAIANSLRSRDNMGAIMALTGDPAAAPVGQQYMESAGKQLQQGLSHNYYQGMLKQSAENQRESSRHNRALEGLASQGNMLRMAVAQLGAGVKTDKYVDKLVQGYGKDAGELIELRTASEQLKEVLAPYAGKGNIPGLGGVMNTSMLGGALATMDPAARTIRAAVNNLFSQRAFSQGGKTLTNNEKQAIIDALAYGVFNSEDDFLKGVERLDEVLASKLSAAQGRWGGPQISEIYRQQMEGPDSVAPPQQQQAPQPDWEILEE